MEGWYRGWGDRGKGQDAEGGSENTRPERNARGNWSFRFERGVKECVVS